MKRLVGVSLLAIISLTGAQTIGPQIAWADGGKYLAMKPKPFSENVRKGEAYLISKQNENGGWSQGEESAYMASVGQRNGEQPNVADTCMAALALVRTGNLPNSGEYAKNVDKAVNFVCDSVEKADQDSLFITDIRGIR